MQRTRHLPSRISGLVTIALVGAFAAPLMPIGPTATAISTAHAASTGDATTEHAGRTNQLRSHEADVRPTRECVIVNGDGTFTAFFGYDNRSDRSVDIAAGRNNRVTGASVAPPTSFAPGRHVAVFSATTGEESLAWRLGGRRATATARSQPCSTNPSVPEAPVTIALLLAPALLAGWWMRRRQGSLPTYHHTQPC